MEMTATSFHEMTQKLILTKELVSLVHFVELNESGWVRRTLGKILLAILCRSQKSMSRIEICEEIKSVVAHDFGSAAVNKAIDLLISQKQITEQPKGFFRVRETALSEINNAVAVTEAEEASTKASFIAALEHCNSELDGEAIWEQFIDLFLLPLIREAGANTLNLLSGAAPLSSRESLKPFLEIFPVDSREDVYRTVVDFLDPSAQDVRQFILKRVAASFFVAAVSLDSATVEALDKKRNTNTSIRLFLDTNTLFSVLGLHENNEDDGVQGLLSLNRNPHAPVKIKLFTFPETIEEATRVLSNTANSMGSRPYAQPLAKAALRVSLSGVHAKYLEAASKTNQPLTARLEINSGRTGV